MRAAYVVLAVVGLALIALSVLSERDLALEGWYSFEEGKKISEKEEKMMFVFVGTDTCGICREFKEFFTTNQTAMEFIKQKFVPVYVDAEKERPVNIFAVPTFCVGFTEDLSCFSATSPEDLMKTLKKIQ